MNEKAYEIILAEISPLLKDNSFALKKDGDLEYFSNGERAVSVTFDEAKQLFILREAALKDGEGVVWSELSHWLYDSDSESDAKSIGRDFEDTIKSSLGVKPQGRTRDVTIPSKEIVGDHIKMEAFVGKFLVLYPQYKDEYKKNISSYREFLYDDFFSKTAVPTLKSMIKTGNKKQCEKLMSLINEGFLNGDPSVVTTVIYTILGGTFIDEPELWETAEPYMEKAQYLKTSGRAMLQLLRDDKAKAKYLFA